MKRLPFSQSQHRSRHGSAVIIVFALLAIMSALIIINNRILYSLKQDLQQIEEHQLQKFAPPPQSGS